jgi:hypothetical protein
MFAVLPEIGNHLIDGRVQGRLGLPARYRPDSVEGRDTPPEIFKAGFISLVIRDQLDFRSAAGPIPDAPG